MKVLSIKEPFASLIKDKRKYIETRSWKTNYRGDIYIHASKTKISIKDQRANKLIDILDDKELNYGLIIAKCRLVDCQYMSEEFIDKIKENKQEYLLGRYEVGRYAWILDNIEKLDEKIPAKGQLGIWNYEKEKRLNK